jgi:hydroxyacylglutathione hydrolase
MMSVIQSKTEFCMTDIKIKRVSILPLGLVNAHLIHDSHSAILVDAGLPGTERHVIKALQAVGLTLQNIKLIVITHAHVDHAGNAAKLRELSKAPIVAHVGDQPYYRREKPMTFCTTGWFGKVFIKTGLMFEPYTAFEPDILLDQAETLDLAPYGFKGVVQPTPGHTAGSLSVLLDSKQALVGDLIASGILLGGIMFTGRAKQPPFEDDPVAVGNTLSSLVSAGHTQFYMGHGGPLGADEVQRHATKLASELESAK